MKTGNVILISVASSVTVFLLCFIFMDRFGSFGTVREKEQPEVSATKVLGSMGKFMKNYAGVALGAQGMDDEEVALKMAGASFDLAGDCLDALSGDDPLIDAVAGFYGATGDALSDPSEAKEELKEFERSVSNKVEESLSDIEESVSRFFDKLF